MLQCQAFETVVRTPWVMKARGADALTAVILGARLFRVTQDPPVLEGLHSRIRAAVMRSVPDWLTSGIDDITQAAWIKLARQGRSEEDLAALRPAYLWRLVHSEVMDEIRRQRRRGEVGLDEAEGLTDDHRPGVEQTAAGRRIGDAIRGCLGLLVVSRRRAVALYLVGHKVPEVAELLGISRKQAENLVFRGITDLRRHLRERGYGRGAE